MKSAAATAFVLLLAAGARAGQRHPVAPPAPSPAPSFPVVPSTPLIGGGITTSSPTPASPSPFTARPGTYAPHYTERAPRSRGQVYGGVPYYDGAIGIGGLVAAPDATAPAPEQQPAQAPEPRVPVPQPVAAVHGPDTFYVIPGCYAGNRPPNPVRLPKGCDVARLRTTPIR